jgi:hypothetical protein
MKSPMKNFTIFSALLFAVSLATGAFAHDTWLIPDQFNLAPKSTVTLDMTSGMEFPKLDTGPKPERVQSAQCRLAGKTFEITNKAAAPHSLQFKAELPEAGVATFWVKLPPRSIELKPEEVKEYLDEVGSRVWAIRRPTSPGRHRWEHFSRSFPKKIRRR